MPWLSRPVPYIIRTLNFWRPLHRPTYLALRLMFRNRSVWKRESKWYEDVLPRKLGIRNRGRYYGFALFKGATESGQPEYRRMLASSPTTAAAEAWALEVVRRFDILPTNKRVFSYLWPATHLHARSYVFYGEGYQARNNAIRQGLAENTSLAAHCFDIKAFYPSIPHEFTKPLLERRLNSSAVDSTTRRNLLGVATGYLAATSGNTGIAVGPPLSHVFGNLALVELDRILEEQYGDRYFRYVDDLVVLAPAGEAKQIEARVVEGISPLGLVLSNAKCHVVPASDWLRWGPHNASEKRATFEALVRDLCFWVALNPDRAGELATKLADSGLRLPVRRCMIDAGYSRYIAFARSALRDNPRAAIQLLRATPDSFLRSALDLRQQLQRVLEAELAGERPEGLLGRWWEQRVRYAANRLLYLADQSELSQLHSQIQRVPCLTLTASALHAVVSKDISSLVRFPGPLVATVASIWPEGAVPAGVNWGNVPYEPWAITSVMDLVLHGLAEVPEVWANGLGEDDRHVLRFCQSSSGNLRDWSGFGYGDEVRTLGLNVSLDDQRALVSKKFDYRESDDMPGLDLGSLWS